MAYTTMIFDIDGTLTDSASAILYTLRKTVLAITGRDYDYKELNFALGTPSYLSLQKLCGDKWQEAARIGQSFYEEAISKIPLFDDIEETITKLYKKGTHLGVVTSKSRLQLGRTFVNYPIYSCFEHIVCEDDTPYHKPDPRPLLECIRRFGTDTASALYIGDTSADFGCAKQAGIDFGLASWGCTSEEEISTDVKLKTPLDLLKYI